MMCGRTKRIPRHLSAADRRRVSGSALCLRICRCAEIFSTASAAPWRKGARGDPLRRCDRAPRNHASAGTIDHATCRAASASGWPSAARSCHNPSFCSWTSRCPRSTGSPRKTSCLILSSYASLAISGSLRHPRPQRGRASGGPHRAHRAWPCDRRRIARRCARQSCIAAGGMPEAAVSLDARIEAHDTTYGLTKIALRGASLLIPEVAGAIGELRRIRVGASDVSLARRGPVESSILNSLRARRVHEAGGLQ